MPASDKGSHLVNSLRHTNSTEPVGRYMLGNDYLSHVLFLSVRVVVVFTVNESYDVCCSPISPLSFKVLKSASR